MKFPLACLVLLAEISGSWQLRAEPLPIETFFRPSSLSGMQLAPDGKHLAAVGFEKERYSLVISDLQTGERTSIVNADAWQFLWLNNQRLLCWAGGTNLYGAIFAINIDGSQEKLLQKPFHTQVSRGGTSHAYQTFSLLRRVSQWSDSVLVERREVTLIKNVHNPEVWRLNHFTGEWILEEKNPGNVVQWFADSTGHVRAAIAVNNETVELLYRPTTEQPWKAVNKSTREELDLFPEGFGPDATHVYVSTHNGGDSLGLYTFDLEAGQLGSQVWSDDTYDLGWVRFAADRVMLVVHQDERFKLTALDPAFAKVQAQVDAALPETYNYPMNASDDWTKILYFRGSDVDPGSFYLVDRAKREFGIVGRCAPWIDSGQLAKVKPIEYPARDGLTIHGYLTLPPHCAGTNLPMIVKPHGGPGARDHWEFDPEVQFLANRGYVVLQMNFRGSSGYGLSFWRAGFKQWGGKMQDDLTDGVRWAISQGIADPSRIGVFGASYGGYAALTGLIKTPELFRCAISYVGVTDVRAITRRSYLEGQARKDFDRAVREEVGDYRADKKELEAISPTHLVEGITVPVLLAYGGRDPIVPVEQGYTLAEALKKQHKKVELIVEKNEGHGFRTLAAQTNLFHRIELFLKENLGN